jgi:hypothetical protein
MSDRQIQLERKFKEIIDREGDGFLNLFPLPPRKLCPSSSGNVWFIKGKRRNYPWTKLSRKRKQKSKGPKCYYCKDLIFMQNLIKHQVVCGRFPIDLDYLIEY